MNIFGHQKIIKELSNRKKFWENVAELATNKEFKTEYRVSLNFAEGERKKIKWHKEQIEKLRKEGGETIDRQQQIIKKF